MKLGVSALTQVPQAELTVSRRKISSRGVAVAKTTLLSTWRAASPLVPLGRYASLLCHASASERVARRLNGTLAR
jgi:hypothetical protein